MNVHTAGLVQSAKKNPAVGILHAAALAAVISVEHVHATMNTRGQRVPRVLMAFRVSGVTSFAIGRPHAERGVVVSVIQNANVWRNGQENGVMSALQGGMAPNVRSSARVRKPVVARVTVQAKGASARVIMPATIVNNAALHGTEKFVMFSVMSPRAAQMVFARRAERVNVTRGSWERIANPVLRKSLPTTWPKRVLMGKCVQRRVCLTRHAHRWVDA